jgi:hypothetical protein
MKRKRKTRYCEFWIMCDRKEDCLKGEYCPVQQPNRYFLHDAVMPNRDRDCTEAFDRIWRGRDGK